MNPQRLQLMIVDAQAEPINPRAEQNFMPGYKVTRFVRLEVFEVEK